MKDILEEITRQRLRRNWTEYKLAVSSGLPQSTISSWYRNHQIPTVQTLEKVCTGLGMTLSQFFAEDGDMICPTEQQKELLDHWSALSEKQQELFLELFKSI